MVPYYVLGGVGLSPVEEHHLDQIASLRNDPTTWRELTDPRPVSRSEQSAWLATVRPRSNRPYFVAVDVEQEGRVVGLVRTSELDLINRSVQVGLDVVPELRGHGYGSRTYDTILSLMFDQWGMHRVWLAVLSTNERARRLYEKKGFVEEGRYREAVFRNGAFVDYVIMSVLEHEYRNGK